MAESVDALVSNTSGATRAGSTPALGTENGGRAIGFRFSVLRKALHENIKNVDRFGLLATTIKNAKKDDRYVLSHIPTKHNNSPSLSCG